MVSTRRLEGDSPVYQVLNAAGSFLLILNSGLLPGLSLSGNQRRLDCRRPLRAGTSGAKGAGVRGRCEPREEGFRGLFALGPGHARCQPVALPVPEAVIIRRRLKKCCDLMKGLAKNAKVGYSDIDGMPGW